MFRQIGDAHGEASTLLSLGEVLEEEGLPDAARESFQRALELTEDANSERAQTLRDHLARF